MSSSINDPFPGAWYEGADRPSAPSVQAIRDLLDEDRRRREERRRVVLPTFTRALLAPELARDDNWNWCPPCKQEVDIPDDAHDGTEVRCLGCRRVYVIVETDGGFFLDARAARGAS